MSRITPEVKADILRMHAEGMTTDAIKKRTGLSTSTVWRVINAAGLKPNAPFYVPPVVHESLSQSDANHWHKRVLADGPRRIAPEHNVLNGATAICKYMRISAISTLGRWVEQYGFPAIKTPDGKWLTTTTAIDQWLWIAAELHAEGKTEMSRIAGRAFHKSNASAHYTSSNIERAERLDGSAAHIIVDSMRKRNERLNRGEN